MFTGHGLIGQRLRQWGYDGSIRPICAFFRRRIGTIRAMKNVPVAALAALSTATLAGTFAARPLTNIQAASTSGYEEVKNWPRLPAGVELGDPGRASATIAGRMSRTPDGFVAEARPPALGFSRGCPARNLISTGKRFETLSKRPSSSFIFPLHKLQASRAETDPIHPVAATRHRPLLAGALGAPR